MIRRQASLARAFLAATLALALVALTLVAAGTAKVQADERVIAARVDRVDRDTVVVGGGSRDGFAERQVLDIYRPARAVKLPLTGDDVLVPYAVVARAVVVDVEASRCRARLVADEMIAGPVGRRATGEERGAARGDLAYVNHLAKAKNVPPFVRELATSQKWAWWGQPVRINVRYTNEPDDSVCFYWAADGGLLEYERTSVPANVWLPPDKPGEHVIRVRIVDSAGNATDAQIKVESKGFERQEAPLGRRSFKRVRTLGDFKDAFRVARDVAFDEQNELYVLDSDRDRVVGMGPDSARRQHFDYSPEFTRLIAHQGFFYAIDEGSKSVKKYPIRPRTFEQGQPAMVFGGPGDTNGRFEEPIDLAVGPKGDLFVLDRARSCVQVFDEAGRFLYSFGGPGTQQGFLGRAVGIAVAPGEDGPVAYILDAQRRKVLVYDAPRFRAEFSVGPNNEEFVDIKRDRISGHLFVLEQTTGSVRRFDPETGRQRDAFGARGMGAANFREPKRMRIDGTQTLHVIDGDDGGSLVRWDVRDVPARFSGRWGGFDLSDDKRIACGPTGNLVSLDTDSAVVTRLDRHGWILGRFGGAAHLDSAKDLCVDHRDVVYVLDGEKGTVVRFDELGVFRGKFGQPGTGRTQLDDVVDIACYSGTVNRLGILQDRDNYNVSVWEYDGIHRQSFPVQGPIEDPLALAIGRNGNYYVVDEEGRVKVFHPFSGALQRTFPNLKLEEVSDLAASNTGHLFVCDYDERTVYVFDDENLRLFGRISGSDEMGKPLDVAVDDYGGLMIYDYATEKIHKYEAME